MANEFIARKGLKTDSIVSRTDTNVKVDGVDVKGLDGYTKNPEFSTPVATFSDVIHLNEDIVDGKLDFSLKGQTATNVIKNGDFSKGTEGWLHSGTYSVSESDGILSVHTPSSVTTLTPSTYNDTNVQHVESRKFFVKLQMRVMQPSTELTVRLADTAFSNLKIVKRITNPIVEQWYEVNEIVTLSASSQENIRFQVFSLNSSFIEGIAVQIKPVLFVDMGVSGSDPLYNLTIEELNERFPRYFEGEQSAMPTEIKSVGKNLLQLNRSDWKRIGSTGTELALGTISFSDDTFQWQGSALGASIIYYPIALKAGKKYTLSSTLNTNGIRIFTDTKDFIGSSIATRTTTGNTTFTAQNVQHYFGFNTFSTSTTATFSNTQLEDGVNATSYEPYTETVQSIPEGTVLRRLPNGVGDEVADGEMIVRTAEHIIQRSDITLITQSTNMAFSTIPSSKLPGCVTFTTSNDRNVLVAGLTQIPNGPFASFPADVIGVNFVASQASQNIFFFFEKGTTIEQARGVYEGVKITYQLANPVVTKLNPGPLVARKNGTIYVEGEGLVPETNYSYPINIAGSNKSMLDIIEGNEKSTLESVREVNEKSTIPQYSASETSFSDVVKLGSKVIEGKLDLQIKGITATNIINNGNFENGNSMWSGITSPSASINSGVLTMNVAHSIMVSQPIPKITKGEKFYAYLWHKSYSDAPMAFTVRQGTTNFHTITLPPVANFWTRRSEVFTARENLDMIRIGRSEVGTTGTHELDNIVVINLTALGLADKTKEELDELFSSYFEGTQSTNVQSVRITGENLANVDYEIGTFGHNGSKATVTNWIRTVNMVPVLPGERYSRFLLGDNYTLGTIRFYDENGRFISLTPDTEIITPGNCRYVHLLFRRSDSATINLSEFELAQYQLIRNSHVVYMDIPEEEALCSLPNGVSDFISNSLHVRKISKEYALKKSDIIELNTTHAVDQVRITLPPDAILLTREEEMSGAISTNFSTPRFVRYNAMVDDIGFHFAGADTLNAMPNRFIYVVEKGKYANVEEARDDLVDNLQGKIRYQLNEAVTTNLRKQAITARKNGVIYIESEGLNPKVAYSYPTNIAGANKSLNDIVVDESGRLEALMSNPDSRIASLSGDSKIRTVKDSYNGISDFVISGANPLMQIVKNGNFENGLDNWTDVQNGTSAVEDGILTHTGTSDSAFFTYPWVQTDYPVKHGEKIFLKARMRVSDLGEISSYSLSMRLWADTGSSTIPAIVSTPNPSEWVDVIGIGEVPEESEGNLRFQLRFQCGSNWVVNGVKMQVDGNVGVFAIPLTGTAFENMTAEQINNVIGNYWEGSESTRNVVVESREINLFNREQVEVGRWNVSPLEKAIKGGGDGFRLSSPIPLKPKTSYVVSPGVRWLHLTDRYGFILRTVGNLSGFDFTTSEKEVFGHPYTVNVNDRMSGDIQINEGNVLLQYHPNLSSRISINLTNPEKFGLSNLRTGVGNIIEYKNGKFKAIQNTAKYVLKESDIEERIVGANRDAFRIRKPIGSAGIGFSTGTMPELYNSPGYRYIGGNTDTEGHVYVIGNTDANRFNFGLPKDLYSTIGEARQGLAGTVIYYQLAIPVVIEEEQFIDYGIDIEGLLLAYQGHSEFVIEADLHGVVDVEYPTNIASSNKGMLDIVSGDKSEVPQYLPSQSSFSDVVHLRNDSISGILDLEVRGQTISTKSSISGRVKSLGKNFAPNNISNWKQGNVAPAGFSSDVNIIHSDFIRVKGGESLTYTVARGYRALRVLEYAERNIDSFIKDSLQSSGDTPNQTTLNEETRYIILTGGRRAGVISLSTSPRDLPEMKPQIEYNLAPTSYEPPIFHTERYYPLTKLRSLPGGQGDEFTKEGKLIKRVSEEYILDGSHVTAMGKIYGIQRVRLQRSELENAITFTNDINDYIHIFGKTQVSNDVESLIAGNAGKYYTLNNGQNTINVIFEDNHFSSEQEAVDYFNENPMTIIFQLNESSVEELPYQAPLVAHPSGVVYHEPVTKLIKSYGEGIITDLPVEHIESVTKIGGGSVELSNVSFEETLEESLIEGFNKYKVEITGAVDGEVYEIVYEFPKEIATNPILVYSYPLNLAGSNQRDAEIFVEASKEIERLNSALLKLEERLSVLETE